VLALKQLRYGAGQLLGLAEKRGTRHITLLKLTLPTQLRVIIPLKKEGLKIQ